MTQTCFAYAYGVSRNNSAVDVFRRLYEHCACGFSQGTAGHCEAMWPTKQSLRRNVTARVSTLNQSSEVKSAVTFGL